MGAQAFVNSIEAKSAQEGFKVLVETATYEHGHDPYNGTISTCSIGRCTATYAEPTEKNIDKAYKFIEDHDFGQKWVADYIDLGPVEDKRTKKHLFLFYGWASC